MKKIFWKSSQAILAASLATALAIYGECTSNIIFKIASIILGFIAALIIVFYNSIREVKNQLKSDMQFLIEKEWRNEVFLRFTFVWEQIEVRMLFEKFQNEYDVVSCIAEVERIDEHKVRNYIRNQIPDLFLFGSNFEVYGILRFGDGNIPDINIYDLSGNFMAVVNYDGRVANKNGIYIAKLHYYSGAFVAYKYFDNLRTRIKSNIPNIIVSEKVIEEIKNTKLSIDRYIFADMIKYNQMQVLDSL